MARDVQIIVFADTEFYQASRHRRLGTIRLRCLEWQCASSRSVPLRIAMREVSMSTSRTTAYLWASVLAVAISSVAIAQQSVSAPAQQEANIPAQIVARTTGVTASQVTRSANKKATSQTIAYRTRSGGIAAAWIIATASSRLIIFWCSSLPRRRNATVPSSASRLPTTSSSGTLARLCSRTL